VGILGGAIPPPTLLEAVDPLLQTAEIFRHEAFLYAGEVDFLTGTLPFLREGIAAGEPVLMVVSAAKIGLLRSALGGDADRVAFADMAEVGANPARIIPAWRDFVAAFDGGGHARGIGEPVWAERTPAELVECQRHETLLNLAFAGVPAWWLLCPYDTTTLGPEVLAEARGSHPFVSQGGVAALSAGYRGLDQAAEPFAAPLPDPPGRPPELGFGPGSLARLRALVAQHGAAAGLARARIADLVLAVDEVATNSLRHGGGRGTLRIWREADAVVCEVRDAGRIEDPMVGRERPAVDRDGGRGLWMVNQLCDLVQLRTFATGAVARLHLYLR
jgi:anti-sigma regulatory factor (Ser/Thr protein kinase)